MSESAEKGDSSLRARLKSFTKWAFSLGQGEQPASRSCDISTSLNGHANGHADEQRQAPSTTHPRPRLPTSNGTAVKPLPPTPLPNPPAGATFEEPPTAIPSKANGRPQLKRTYSSAHDDDDHDESRQQASQPRKRAISSKTRRQTTVRQVTRKAIRPQSETDLITSSPRRPMAPPRTPTSAEQGIWKPAVLALDRLIHQSGSRRESSESRRSSILGTLFSPVVAMFNSPEAQRSEPAAKRAKSHNKFTREEIELHLVDSLEVDAVQFLNTPPECPSPSAPFSLPDPEPGMASRPVLVLDLDETLVHASMSAMDGYDRKVDIYSNNRLHVVYVKLRPYVREFLTEVSKLFEVVVFTASQQAYADVIMDWLDPRHRLIHHRLFRQHCTYVQGIHVKDLRTLGRPLERMVIVDNSPQVFALQLTNGIPILSYIEGDDDEELHHLLPFLRELAASDADYRVLVEERFQLPIRLQERADALGLY